MFRVLMILALAFSFTACESKSETKADEKKTEAKAEGGAEKGAQEAAPAEEAAGEEAPAEEAAAAEGGPTDLPQVGLKAELPAGANVSDGIGGGVMVMAPGLVFSVAEATDSTPADLEAAKGEADMYSPENIQTEDLADGFVMTFENTGGMGKNYWVNVRREIDGKGYWCTTTANDEDQQKAAVAACKSLTK